MCGRQARQLESLVRLAEARARVELSQTVTREHAEVTSCYLPLSPAGLPGPPLRLQLETCVAPAAHHCCRRCALSRDLRDYVVFRL